METRYKCLIQYKSNGSVFNDDSRLEITSPTGNTVSLKIGYEPDMIPENIWHTYAKLIYRKSWMTYMMLTKKEMSDILYIKDHFRLRA